MDTLKAARTGAGSPGVRGGLLGVEPEGSCEDGGLGASHSSSNPWWGATEQLRSLKRMKVFYIDSHSKPEMLLRPSVFG